jgi:hypothetical protein
LSILANARLCSLNEAAVAGDALFNAVRRVDVCDMTVRNFEMKSFMIKYRFKSGSEDQWHQDIARFISALDDDPALVGKISYRCLKTRDQADYYHLATVTDDDVVKALQSRAFFKRYTEQTNHAGGGEVEVLPLETVAETEHRF